MKWFITLTVLASTLLAQSFTLSEGWNLLGTDKEISTSDILSDTNIKNVVIYQNGVYKSTADNEISVIPASYGFWAYAESATTLSMPSVEIPNVSLKKFDSNLNEVDSSATVWDILEVIEANLYVEMKTNAFIVGSTYTWSQAEEYCSNLTIGSKTEWRLPTQPELSSLANVYQADNNKNYFLIKNSDVQYWTSTVTYSTSGWYSNVDFEGNYSPNADFARASDNEANGANNAYYAVCVHDK